MKVGGSQFSPPASLDKIGLLRGVLPSETPADYFEFLNRSDGGKVWFEDVDHGIEPFDCLRFDSADEMLDEARRRTLAELIPDLLVIGGDQGSQYLGYDIVSCAPWPIVLYFPGYGIIPVAQSMKELAGRFFLDLGSEIS